MDNDPKTHGFFAKYPDGESCKHCQFHKRAHPEIDPKSPTMTRQEVDIKFMGRIVGTAVVETDGTRADIVSSKITDPELIKVVSSDITQFSIGLDKRKKV